MPLCRVGGGVVDEFVLDFVAIKESLQFRAGHMYLPQLPLGTCSTRGVVAGATLLSWPKNRFPNWSAAGRDANRGFDRNLPWNPPTTRA